MEKDMNDLMKYEITFLFYDEYFVYYPKSKVKKARTIRYDEISAIDYSEEIVSFFTFKIFTLTINGQKPLRIGAGPRKEFIQLSAAIEYIKARRLEIVLENIRKIDGEKKLDE